jgi:hypothetical protein
MCNLDNIISQLDKMADNPVGTYQYIIDLGLEEPNTLDDNQENFQSDQDYLAFCDYAEQCLFRGY